MKVNNIKELQDSIKSSETVREEFLKNPEKFLLEVESPIQNKKVFLTVVYIVGFALIISLIIAALLVLNPIETGQDELGNPTYLLREVDNFFVMISSAAIGALAGLLAPSPME